MKRFNGKQLPTSPLAAHSARPHEQARPVDVDQEALDRVAAQTIARYSPLEVLALARGLFDSEIVQVRLLAVCLAGELAPTLPAARAFLRHNAARDVDPRVQAALARAFAKLCAAVPAERVPRLVETWLADNHPTLRLAVINGLRIWIDRPYFRDSPQAAVRQLSQLHRDESPAVRRAAAAALGEIADRYPALVAEVTAGWDRADPLAVESLALVYLRTQPGR